MAEQKLVGRRQLLSQFVTDLKYLGGALIPASALELAEIGIAKISQDQCLAYRGQLCSACYYACSVEPRAIELTASRYPVVREERCNGCGDCVRSCLAPIPAITVPAPPLKVLMFEGTNGR